MRSVWIWHSTIGPSFFHSLMQIRLRGRSCPTVVTNPTRTPRVQRCARSLASFCDGPDTNTRSQRIASRRVTRLSQVLRPERGYEKQRTIVTSPEALNCRCPVDPKWASLSPIMSTHIFDELNFVSLVLRSTRIIEVGMGESRQNVILGLN